MTPTRRLKHPWLVAVWPGAGHVALSAGYYLLAKLGMHQLAEFSSNGLFDVEHVEVKAGRIQPTQLPRNRFFVWQDPAEQRDIVVFIGEAQPPLGKYAFCEKLIDYARDLGVEQIFTFAAMATQMHPKHKSQVYAAATEDPLLQQLQEEKWNLELLQEGHIGGLNGVLLGAAADKGMPGVCLLGEMPQIFAQLPFPKASLAVLKAFTGLADMQIDFTELAQQAEAVEHRMGEFLANMEQELAHRAEQQHVEESSFAPLDEDSLDEESRQHIEALFRAASKDRSKAYELKNELDRLEVFAEYEDRFLDLFKQNG
ncbi:MAG: PAC2 family protein [Planctomycetales bacterium]|nr:PAC2 family protein [Planctomycetales bacterium]